MPFFSDKNEASRSLLRARMNLSADVVPNIIFLSYRNVFCKKERTECLIDIAGGETLGHLDDVAIDEQRIETSLQVKDAFCSVRNFSGQQFHHAISAFREFSCPLFGVGLSQFFDGFVLFYRAHLFCIFFSVLPMDSSSSIERIFAAYSSALYQSKHNSRQRSFDIWTVKI